MIKPGTDCAMASQSPISGSSKHQTTPLRTRWKTSRKDHSSDVHTCSTPIRLQSETASSILNSPDSYFCSQDNRPDVIWDYTSPKPPLGCKKKEIKITVDEFLKNISHSSQVPDCNTQNSNYIKLLEKWMAKQNTPVCVKKPTRTIKRDQKMRSRRVFEEIKQFMVSIQEEKDKAAESNRNESSEKNSLSKNENLDGLDTSLNKKSLLENNLNDSLEELWGETDNSFIVKATQHMDVSCMRYDAQNKNVDILSTIPETMDDQRNEHAHTNEEEKHVVEKTPLNKTILDSDQQAQILLSQIMSCDWDSDSENEDLENGFIMGDDDLSSIPDELLCGGSENKFDNKCGKIEQKYDNQKNDKTQDMQQDSKTQDYVNKSPEITFGCSKSSTKATFEVENMSEIELFNNFEDDSFGDESILCQPEVLSWIDEIENKLSQSQKCSPEESGKKKNEDIPNDKLSPSQKCTPQEIEKKKIEAIQRRKKLQLRNRKT